MSGLGTTRGYDMQPIGGPFTCAAKVWRGDLGPCAGGNEQEEERDRVGRGGRFRSETGVYHTAVGEGFTNSSCRGIAILASAFEQ